MPAEHEEPSDHPISTGLFDYEDAETAADAVFEAELTKDPPPGAEPADEAAAAAAVRRLSDRFADLPAAIRQALRGAERNAAQLSDDRLQGLAELIQNADDVGATEVRFQVSKEGLNYALLASHNGAPIRLRDVMGLATPWLSLRSGTATATGRFGIGLMTLRSLSDTLDVHCGCFHLRLGAQTLTPLDGESPASEVLGGHEWTIFRIPLDRGNVGVDEVLHWIHQWGDAALMFLSSVRTVSLIDQAGNTLEGLHLSVQPQADISMPLGRIERRIVTAGDHRGWAIYSRDVRTTARAHRAEKALENTTRVAVAFPLGHAETGWVHVGLPIRPIGLPFRISCQFDPLANRRDLADTEWNAILTEPLSMLWLDASLDMFNERPRLAWAIVPHASDLEGDERTSGRFRAALDTNLIRDARKALAYAVTFTTDQNVDGENLGLDRLAVEHPALTAVLSTRDISQLSGADAALPSDARDDAGIWRTVLDEFGLLGGPTPIAVTIYDALPLLEDTSRPAAFVADLTAAALSADLSEALTQYPCVVLADGSHMRPPAPHSAFAIIDGVAHPVWDTLRMGAHVHADYINTASWSAVLGWLSESARLLTNPGSADALERLADAGRSGKELPQPLTDEQADAIRAALEQSSDLDRTRLGPDIGRAVRLDATSYDDKGQRIASHVRLCDAYIIERDSDSWSVAAGKTPGLTWLHRRYAQDLRASTGRAGLGPQRLFKMLGAETAPRLRPHPSAQQRYTSGPPGVPLSPPGSPDTRLAQMRRLGATHTTEDYDSPDLEAVVRNIAADKNAKNRRRRAAAVIGSLARAWDRLGDCQHANAVDTDYGWVPKGEISAWWLLKASDTQWLTNGRGAARKPAELRLRTPGTLAVYGNDPSKFLATDIDAPNRRPVLQALGVAGDPPASEFIRGLEQLRDKTLHDPARAVIDRAAPLYQALASQIGSLGSSSPRIGDLAVRAASSMFNRGPGLVITNLGWRRPSVVLLGPPIFGDLRPFVPSVDGTERLWQLLGIRGPGFPAARAVMLELSRKRTIPSAERQLIMLETLRLMATHISLSEASGAKLSRLALWTSQGWLSSRPVYAVMDPQVAHALANLVPVWQPGGDPAQFEPLLEPLGVTCLEPSAASVVDSAGATTDEAATRLFNQAVRLLQEDLSLNDPTVESCALVPWDELASYKVAVLPELVVMISGTNVHPRPTVRVAALIDRSSATMFASDFDAVGKVGSGGRAIASLFASDQRRLAQAWHAAWDAAQEGRDTRVVTLASRRAEDEAAVRQIANTARLHKLARDATTTRKSPLGDATKGPAASADGASHTARIRPARYLVDPDAWELVNSHGEVIPEPTLSNGPNGSGSAGGTSSPELRSPDTNRTKKTSGGSRGPTNYTADERESVGMALVMHALSSDQSGMADIRDQRNVGADAVDQLQRFFELKVHAGAIPDEIRLTDSEVQRALSTAEFFLVLVGNVERGAGQPEIRIITDPLNQLRVEAAGMIRLSGINRAQSLTYTFRPLAAKGGEADDA